MLTTKPTDAHSAQRQGTRPSFASSISNLRAMRQALARRAIGDHSREHKTAFWRQGVIPLVVGAFGESSMGLLKNLLKCGLGMRPQEIFERPSRHWPTRTERGEHSPSCTPRQAMQRSNGTRSTTSDRQDKRGSSGSKHKSQQI